jgi:hypothetical protein
VCARGASSSEREGWSRHRPASTSMISFPLVVAIEVRGCSLVAALATRVEKSTMVTGITHRSWTSTMGLLRSKGRALHAAPSAMAPPWRGSTPPSSVRQEKTMGSWPLDTSEAMEIRIGEPLRPCSISIVDLGISDRGWSWVWLGLVRWSGIQWPRVRIVSFNIGSNLDLTNLIRQLRYVDTPSVVSFLRKRPWKLNKSTRHPQTL